MHEVRERALALVERHPEELLADYLARFGNVLNADNAAELFPEYSASNECRARFRAAVHPAAQWVRDELFKRSLGDPSVREVVFTAGGNGAGKTSEALSGDVVMDTTLSNVTHSAQLVQAALDAGKRVQIVYTYRPIQEAFRGVLDRARTQGRTVSVGTMISTHDGAARTVQFLAKQYGGNPDVDFEFVDNTGMKSKQGTVALAKKQDYLGTRDELYGILDAQSETLPEYIYRAAQGTDRTGAGPPTGETGDRQPEPAPPGEGSR